ncbi:MAG: DHA2 family efflux MFS transporter permease subunit [Alphaproteobacteria bacterium]|nr:DHA2 family efflux MFS transporter permease subunit [Alphaproteobacteria bacterium]
MTATGMLAAFTMVIASTIVNVAVPDVIGAFGVSQSEVQLMATAFNIAMTTGQLLNAWAVSVFGQRYGYTATLVLFTIGSVVAGAAETFDMIVIGRVLQGAAAGIIQPLIMVTLFRVFPEGKRGQALGLYAMGLVFAASVGPVFGGIAIEAFDWRAIFFMPLVLVAVCVPLGLMFMPAERNEEAVAFDWLGYTLIVLSMYCLVTAISNGHRDGWVSDYIVGLFVVALLAGVGFLLSQRREAASLLDLSLFKNKMFTLAVLVTALSAVGNFATVYAIPVAAQLVQNMTPLDAGLALMPAMMVAVIIMPISGRLSDRIAPHKALIFGLTFLAFGALPFAFADANTSFLKIVAYGLVGRWATAFVQPFIMNTALKTLPPEKLNSGGGTVNFCRHLAGSIGTNIWVVFVDWRIEFHSEQLSAMQSDQSSASASLLRGVAQIFREAGVPENVHTSGGLHYLGQMIEAQATALSFQDGFWVLFFSYLLGIIPAIFLGIEYNKRRKK